MTPVILRGEAEDAISEESSRAGSSDVSKFSFVLDASELREAERNELLKQAEAESDSDGSDSSIRYK